MKTGFVIIPINRLVKAEWNYKYDDEVIQEKLKENIKRNGLIENLIVRELPNGKFEVVNGNHRLDAIVELELKEVMCYNLGKVKDHIAKRIAIETNETRFVANPTKLADILKELTDHFTFDDLLETLPLTYNELESITSDLSDSMFESSAFEPTVSTTHEPSVKQSKEGITCPNCGHKFKL